MINVLGKYICLLAVAARGSLNPCHEISSAHHNNKDVQREARRERSEEKPGVTHRVREGIKRLVSRNKAVLISPLIFFSFSKLITEKSSSGSIQWNVSLRKAQPRRSHQFHKANLGNSWWKKEDGRENGPRSTVTCSHAGDYSYVNVAQRRTPPPPGINSRGVGSRVHLKAFRSR